MAAPKPGASAGRDRAVARSRTRRRRRRPQACRRNASRSAPRRGSGSPCADGRAAARRCRDSESVPITIGMPAASHSAMIFSDSVMPVRRSFTLMPPTARALRCACTAASELQVEVAEDGDRQRLRQQRHAGEVGAAAGILDEVDAVVGELRQDRSGLELGVLAVGVDIDRQLVADRLAHLAHQRDVLLAAPPDLELQPLVAAVEHHALRLPRPAPRGYCRARPRSAAPAVAGPPPSSRHTGSPQELAAQVPQRDVDQRLGRAAVADAVEPGEDARGDAADRRPPPSA